MPTVWRDSAFAKCTELFFAMKCEDIVSFVCVCACTCRCNVCACVCIRVIYIYIYSQCLQLLFAGGNAARTRQSW